MSNTVVGKVAALEKQPSTNDEFVFWTKPDVMLSAFDVVKVDNLNNSVTYGIVIETNHITDTPSYLGSFVSSDFGDTDTKILTNRLSMNYVMCKVLRNTKNIYLPVHDGNLVSLADEDDIKHALGLLEVKSPILCGYLDMYSHISKKSLRIPVNFSARFLIGPEGSHLNISGISGLAAKTSYCMFLIKSMQDIIEKDQEDSYESVAYVVFNVKGKDLLALDEPNDSLPESDKKLYEQLNINPQPFNEVSYYYPYSSDAVKNTYAPSDLLKRQVDEKKAFYYRYTYMDDREDIDMLLAHDDDPTGTMEAICDQIITGSDGFDSIDTWGGFMSKVKQNMQSGKTGTKGEITANSWKKFKRIITKPLNNPVFGNRCRPEESEIRLDESLRSIKKNEIHVIDIARLDESMQSFVFGSAIKKIYDLKLSGEYDEERKFPDKIVVFVDELNKYAGSDVPKNSPLLRTLLDISERGRSLGIVLFGAEQFKSSIHERIKGNCATHCYGRTNSIEISKKDYSFIPSTYKNIMTRLSQGEYIITNPLFPSPLQVKFPRPVYKQFEN